MKKILARLGLLLLVLAGTLGCAGTGYRSSYGGYYDEQGGPTAYYEQPYGYYDQHRFYAPQGPLGWGRSSYTYQYYWGNNNPFGYRDLR